MGDEPRPGLRGERGGEQAGLAAPAGPHRPQRWPLPVPGRGLGRRDLQAAPPPPPRPVVLVGGGRRQASHGEFVVSEAEALLGSLHIHCGAPAPRTGPARGRGPYHTHPIGWPTCVGGVGGRAKTVGCGGVACASARTGRPGASCGALRRLSAPLPLCRPLPPGVCAILPHGAAVPRSVTCRSRPGRRTAHAAAR